MRVADKRRDGVVFCQAGTQCGGADTTFKDVCQLKVLNSWWEKLVPAAPITRTLIVVCNEQDEETNYFLLRKYLELVQLV